MVSRLAVSCLITYMNNFNTNDGTHLVSVADLHYEPFGIYAGKSASPRSFSFPYLLFA